MFWGLGIYIFLLPFSPMLDIVCRRVHLVIPEYRILVVVTRTTSVDPVLLRRQNIRRYRFHFRSERSRTPGKLISAGQYLRVASFGKLTLSTDWLQIF